MHSTVDGCAYVAVLQQPTDEMPAGDDVGREDLVRWVNITDYEADNISAKRLAFWR